VEICKELLYGDINDEVKLYAHQYMALLDDVNILMGNYVYYVLEGERTARDYTKSTKSEKKIIKKAWLLHSTIQKLLTLELLTENKGDKTVSIDSIVMLRKYEKRIFKHMLFFYGLDADEGIKFDFSKSVNHLEIVSRVTTKHSLLNL